jgi:hypothetical protein
MEKLDNPTQEDFFDIWAEELIVAGYIDEVVRPPDVPTFELFSGLKKDYTETKITRGVSKLVNKFTTLMRPVSYTPDRIIKWNIKSLGIFFYPFTYGGSAWKECYFTPQQAPEGFHYSLIDVKGPTGSQKAYGSDFKFTQKWLWANTQQYVQKVMLAPALTNKKPEPYLWASTFTPNRFLHTDKLSTSKNKPDTFRTIPNKKGVPHWEVRSLEEFLILKK